MKILINNFCGSDPIGIMASDCQQGPLVNIVQTAGGMYFQHSMNLTQAVELANAIMNAVASFDEVTA